MKKTTLQIGLGLLALMILVMVSLNSCKKDETRGQIIPGSGSGTGGSEVQWSNSEMTTATFIGQVVKEDGTPLIGATVSTGTHQFITDADGFFYFANITTAQNATLIKVEKVGFFKSYRTLSVIPKQDNSVKMMVMELPTAQNLNASAGGLITISNGGSINFPANAIIDDVTKQAYTGMVNVYAKWIDPSSNVLDLLLPGDLRGINSNGGEQALTTYGMHAVELVGAAGQKLQLGNGLMATVQFPLPASMIGDAPTTIPLWHFDEVKGMWIEDGTANKKGSYYEGDVSHFSFWNCDINIPFVYFNCQLVDPNNTPICGADVKLIPNSTLYTARTATTNSQGKVTGKIPANVSYKLEYLPSGCAYSTTSTVFLQNFTAVSTDIDLGTIGVSNVLDESIIHGITKDCNNQLLAYGIVKLKIGNSKVLSTMSDANGVFTFHVNCLPGATPITITAFDAPNGVHGNSNITVSPNTIMNIGDVVACGVQNDFITIDVTSPPATTPTVYTIVAPDGTFKQDWYSSQNLTRIYGFGDPNAPNGITTIRFNFDGPQTVAGTHVLQGYMDSNCSLFNSTMFTPTLVNFTKYEAIGGFMEGSFSLNTINSNGYSNNTLLNCSFRLTRQE